MEKLVSSLKQDSLENGESTEGKGLKFEQFLAESTGRLQGCA